MIMGILLAAGAARRMGSDKLALPWRESTVLGVTLGAWTAVPELNQILLVRRATSPEIQMDRVQTLVNPDADEGIGSSLRFAAHALQPGVKAVVVGLADMPEVTSATISALVEAWKPLGAAGIVAPRYNNRRGHPVVFGAQHFPALEKLTGDQGARTVLQSNTTSLHVMEVDDPGVLLDIDTPADLGQQS